MLVGVELQDFLNLFRFESVYARCDWIVCVQVIGHGADRNSILTYTPPSLLFVILALLLAQQVLRGLLLEVMQLIDQVGGLAELELLALVLTGNVDA